MDIQLLTQYEKTRLSDRQPLPDAYLRLPDDGDRLRFDYAAPAFATRCVIVYDAAMLALDYPGIAVRAASTRG